MPYFPLPYKSFRFILAVDIYVFDDNGTYKFSVAKHVELLTITVVNRYYIGSAFEKTDAAPSQDCVKGAQFDPIDQSAKDSLFEAIEKYPGSVIIVSHEKDFYDGLVDYEMHF